MSSMHKVAKGDLFLQSKHADVSFDGGPDGWAMFFSDTPVRGKCLSVEWYPGNWPAAHVSIRANWKAEREIASIRRDKEWEEKIF